MGAGPKNHRRDDQFSNPFPPYTVRGDDRRHRRRWRGATRHTHINFEQEKNYENQNNRQSRLFPSPQRTQVGITLFDNRMDRRAEARQPCARAGAFNYYRP